MSFVAIVAWGDLVGIVRHMNVWIHLFALVRNVTCGPLCEFLKRAMAAKAGFGVRLSVGGGTAAFSCAITRPATGIAARNIAKARPPNETHVFRFLTSIDRPPICLW